MPSRLLPSVLAALATTVAGSAPQASPPATPLPLAAGDGSGMYALAPGADGRVYLIWIEPLAGQGHALKFSRLEQRAWTTPKTIATGADWFVNWADHPSITALADGTLFAHWLVRNPGASGAYGYGIRIARSPDGGATWSEIFKAGLDNGADYSGFVAMLPDARGLTAVYLHPAAPAPLPAAGARPGEDEHVKTLKVARFSAAGALASDETVDPDVCQCCNTSIVQTSDGPVAAYRDHRPGEIRDISVVRYRNGRWSAPAAVHEDGWRINACPTNGPVLAASGRRVAVAWFTAAGNTGRVRLAFSSDAGEHFGMPLTIDEARPVGWPGLVMLDDGSAVVSWLGRVGEGQGEVRLRRVWPDGLSGEVQVVAGAGSGRATGIPQLARAGRDLVIAWRTDRVMTAMVPIPQR